MQNRRLLRFAVLIPVFLLLSVITVPGQEPSTVPNKQKPFAFSKANTVIYVSDFELDSADFQTDQPAPRIRPVRPHVLNGPLRGNRDSGAQAQNLVSLMANDIVKDLVKAGYKAQYLAAGDVRPSQGVWVHGVFTELNEGSRLQRAVIGFGSGQTKMNLYVTITDLSQPLQPLYSSAVSGESGKKPGAVITLNPYVAAAKFVMEKNAPEKTVKKTASDISKDIIAHLK